MGHRDVNCPCCASESNRSYWAIIAPFISDYVRPSHSPIVRLLECKSCGHRFFSYRYSANEMGRLYGEYRSEDYFLTRHKVEPWYRRATNAANLDPGLIKQRTSSLLRFLQPFLPAQNRKVVIADVGGDAGQFIPLQIAKAAYLIEASDQKPVDGVFRIGSLDDLPDDVDLVICAHVLEHLPDPASFLARLVSAQRIKPGSLIYLEVPLEHYRLSRTLSSRLYAHYLRTLLRIRPALLLIDFLSVLSRSYAGVILPPLVLKMHEHINFFTVMSLTKCLGTEEIEVIAVHQETGSFLATHQGVIRLLARRTDSPPDRHLDSSPES